MGLILVGKFYKDEAALVAEAKDTTTINPAEKVKLVQSGSSSDTEDKVEGQIKARTIYSY